MPDHDRSIQVKLLAEKGEVVGEPLHGVALMRLVAFSVPAQIDGHDAMARPREMRKLRREERVVAAPAMHQQDRPLRALRLLEEERDAVPPQRRHAPASAWRLRSISRQIIGVKMSCMASGILAPGQTMVFGRDMNELGSIDRR